MENSRLKDKLKLKDQITVASVASLQKDEPVDQLAWATTETPVDKPINSSKMVDPKTKAFFLYPRDGLYGLF